MLTIHMALEKRNCLVCLMLWLYQSNTRVSLRKLVLFVEISEFLVERIKFLVVKFTFIIS